MMAGTEFGHEEALRPKGDVLVPLVLASGSAIRAQMLREAGVNFRVQRPDVDEDATKRRLVGQSGEDIAVALAREKALSVSRSGDERVVLGADQILRFNGALFDKVGSVNDARERLKALRGATHDLVSGVCVAKGGDVVGEHVQVSRLTMRAFSDSFLDWYLDHEGDAILASVGCYRFEGPGAQLFAGVDGEYFAVLGLPLMVTLDMLRKVGAVSV